MVATIIVLTLLALNLVLNFIKHGQPKNTHYDFRIAILSAIYWLMMFYFMGVFDNFK